MTPFRKRLLILALCSVAVLAAFIFLHELGHSVVALACGARITEFSVITAHMRSEGGYFTAYTGMLLNAGGMLLPYIFGVVWLIFYSGRRRGGVYLTCAFVYYTASLYSVTPWILIPITYAYGYAPAGDDVTKLLITYSALGGSPVTVSCAAALMLVFYLALLFRKEPVRDFMDYMAGKSVREDGAEAADGKTDDKTDDDTGNETDDKNR